VQANLATVQQAKKNQELCTAAVSKLSQPLAQQFYSLFMREKKRTSSVAPSTDTSYFASCAPPAGQAPGKRFVSTHRQRTHANVQLMLQRSDEPSYIYPQAPPLLLAATRENLLN
jgi:hypothetical protein